MIDQERAVIEVILSERGVERIALPVAGTFGFRQAVTLLSGVVWALDMLDATARHHGECQAGKQVDTWEEAL